MIIDTDKLVTVKNYACDNRIVTKTVYNRLESGKIKGVKIDGVQFIVVENENKK